MGNTIKRDGTSSWKTIIILLIIFWPVGIYLMYKKINEEKASTLKYISILNIFGWAFVILAIMFAIGIIGGEQAPNPVATILFFGGGGIFLIYASKKMKINELRFRKYISIVINNNEIIIDNIAAAIPTNYEDAVKDLQKMINKGYFPGAYIDVANREIVLSEKRNSETIKNDQFEKHDSYEKQRKAKVMICKNCGGNNKVIEGEVCECEFCGSLLQ